MSPGQRAVVRRVLTASWLLASIAGVSNGCALNRPPANRPRTLAKDVCRAQDKFDPNEAIVKGGYVGRDAKVHFTFGIEEKVAPAQKTAFGEAVKQWNNWSEVTRMVLEQGPPGGPFDITLGVSDDPKAHCAVHQPWDSSVRYHLDMKFADDDPMLAARIYVHEIGHVFGVAHPRDGGVMDYEIFHFQSGTCAIGAGKLKSISRNDAENARDCAFPAHVEHQYRLAPK